MTVRIEESAAELYGRAHDLHYIDGDLDRAAVLYAELRARFPGATEARYARTQLDNIERRRSYVPPGPRTLEQRIADEFQCRCGARDCTVSDARLGGGSAYRDDHGSPYLAVACKGCARVELLDRSILEGREDPAGG